MSRLAAARARLRLLFSRRAANARADEEIDFHLAMEAERLMREEGLSPDEAGRRARVAFGGVTQHREALREGIGFGWLGGFALDMKVGFRMLRKYPGLTIIGSLAMGFAIWVGAVTFQVLSLIVFPSLPLPDGERIVQVGNWDLESQGVDGRALHEFLDWRGRLSTITDLGAYRDVTRNLITADGDARGVSVAEITASAFRIAPTPPLLGRTIIAADELPGAQPVAVLGHDIWRARFAGDAGVIGRSVRMGDEVATIVGVMPDGFAFPVAHESWMAFRPDRHEQVPRGGPAISIFGRLAPGATFESAQAELTTLGRRTAAAYPATHEHLQPRVVPYAKGFASISGSDLGFLTVIYAFVVMLLVLVCSNVALLLFARAATRESELAVRSALGASRGRIVMQLFAEALLLGAIAAVVGLATADYALRTWAVRFLEVNQGPMPFWYDIGLSPTTIAYALLLTLLGAAIAGVLPALRITRGLGARLKQGSAGSGLRFGGVWTAVIVAQVAVTVAFPTVLLVERRMIASAADDDVGFRAGEYLAARLDSDSLDVRYGAALEELRRRLEVEPGVRGVSFVNALPRMDHPGEYVELDDAAGAAGQGMGGVPATPSVVRTALIDPSYFDVLQSPVVAGRGFTAAETASGARVVVVDQAFVDSVLLGRSAVGRRVRFIDPRQTDPAHAAMQPWHEIVGVAREMGMRSITDTRRRRVPGVYLPADLADAPPMHVVIHASGDPLALAPRLHALAAAVDPLLRVSGVQRVDQVADAMLWIARMWLRLSLLLTGIAVLLSLAGIYAVLSFTVARRTREIGVRVALGASRRRLVFAIFRRPLTHVLLGVAVGAGLIVLGAIAAANGDGGMARVEGGFSVLNVALLLAYMVVMLAVCLLACIVPTQRALGVEPTEALRAE